MTARFPSDQDDAAMTMDPTILDGLDPDLATSVTSRRDLFHKAALTLGGLATAPTMLAAVSTEAFGQGAALPKQVIDTLNFALTLELLEDELYRTALAQPTLIPFQFRTVFAQVGANEAAHVAFLRTALGPNAIPKPQFDLTGGGLYPDVLTNFNTFSGVSQASEETGVRAYKGQAGNLMGYNELLTAALRIHSVEARHVAEIRRVRGEFGWITGSSRGNLPASTQPRYDGEGQTTQAGVRFRSVPPFRVTEAFDEPLTRAQVLAITRPFIVSM